MGLKRKAARAYSIDEMLFLINYDFIESGRAGKMKDNENYSYYVLGPTCFSCQDRKYMMCDSRDNTENTDIDGLLEVYYGSTIEEVITKCFMDRVNHLIYRIDAKLDG